MFKDANQHIFQYNSLDRANAFVGVEDFIGKLLSA